MKARGEALRNLRGKMAELHNDAATYEGGYAISCSALFAFIKEIDTILAAQPTSSPAVGGKALAKLAQFKKEDGFWIFRRNRKLPLKAGDIYTDIPFDVVAAPPASPLRGREDAMRTALRECISQLIPFHEDGDQPAISAAINAGQKALASPQQPDPFVLHETVHDGKVMQTVLMPGSGASELVREKPGERANDRTGAGVIIDHEEIILAATSTDNCPGEK